MTPTDSDCYRAVLERDTRYDGTFVYAVRSTGIYCRPSCPSRKPARGRVRFFPTPAEAEAAGFRACRRCRPATEAPEVARAREVCRYLEAHHAEAVTLEQLGRRFGLSPSHLQRSFKALTGLSPRQYQAQCRMRALRGALAAGEAISHATFDSGFGSSSRLYGQADARLGMTPGRYRQQGRAVEIAYGFAQTPLGLLMVALSARGVCAVSLGDDEAGLESELRATFGQASLRRDDEGLADVLRVVLEVLGGSAPHDALPRDVRATAFQEQVWRALQEIPRGETRSYREVAALLGRPGAARAVARACASNPTALLVPCHRVVRQDGEPGGYRWGAARKRRLLALERGEN